MALGRHPDYAINHSVEALAIHAANHPTTHHLSKSIWAVDPIEVIGHRPIGLLWASPDCRSFSKAKNGKPRSKRVRDLAWAVVRWLRQTRSATFILENVEEFAQWGPLTIDGKPCPERLGQTYNAWKNEIKRLGYKIEERELRACDWGAPTIRKRLFVIGRRDGKPIVWPKPTHGDPQSEAVKAGLLRPWRTAAEIIDWSIPTPSIFDSTEEIKRKYGVRARRPLADATLRRIARGVKKYIIDAKEPYIAPVGPDGQLGAAALAQTGYGERPGQAPRALDIMAPIGTQVAGGAKHGLVAAFLAQANLGMVGHSMTEPVSTLTTKGSHQQVIAAHLLTLRGSDRRDAPVTEPLRTVSAGGQHAGVVAAFMMKYYGTAVGFPLSEPMHTDTTKDRFGLVTVEINGEPYVITDIGFRMLTPRERFLAQGFPEDYEIERGVLPDGRTIELSGEAQGRLCGNSVCPPLAAALVRANVPHLAVCSDVAEDRAA